MRSARPDGARNTEPTFKPQNHLQNDLGALKLQLNDGLSRIDCVRVVVVFIVLDTDVIGLDCVELDDELEADFVVVVFIRGFTGFFADDSARAF